MSAQGGKKKWREPLMFVIPGATLNERSRDESEHRSGIQKDTPTTPMALEKGVAQPCPGAQAAQRRDGCHIRAE